MYNELLKSIETNPALLREKRSKVFKAFDIYKQNVNYGIIEESQEQHETVLQWYRNCLDLNSEAINNIPDEIKPFCEKINF